jgi:membrane protein YdbS with pleckstrin-like domain
MNLLINKDGKQLGPYSLDQARALVLSGELTANDWAFPDGATQWVHLRDVPGFSPDGASNSTPSDQPSSTVTAEKELWRGHPSQILNFSTFSVWTLILLFVLAMAFVIKITYYKIPVSLIIVAVVVLVALIRIIGDYLRLRAIEYIVTTQRVRILSGLFSKDIQEIELFRVKDTMAHQSFLLRLFGLGTITILSGDAHTPQLILTAVPHAIELREKIRQEVMTLRQRFGVRELDVM